MTWWNIWSQIGLENKVQSSSDLLSVLFSGGEGDEDRGRGIERLALWLRPPQGLSDHA